LNSQTSELRGNGTKPQLTFDVNGGVTSDILKSNFLLGMSVDIVSNTTHNQYRPIDRVHRTLSSTIPHSFLLVVSVLSVHPVHDVEQSKLDDLSKLQATFLVVNMFEKAPPFHSLQASLEDPSYPIGMRMRAAYFLRQVYHSSPDDASGAHPHGSEMKVDVIKALTNGLLDDRHGSLMRHEFAYVLGQLRDDRAVPTLELVLQNANECVMVRHEAAEALGAIGSKTSEPILRKVMLNYKDSLPELSDTCRLSLNVMEWRDNGQPGGDPPVGCACMLNPYSSVDPAPPNPLHDNLSFEELGDLLCDSERDIFDRYRAMFSLRNRGSEPAVKQLCRALTQDASSALLRHEVGYVLGQMQHPSSVEALEESLRRADEHMMVRHEAAEALGAIDGRWEDVERILSEFSADPNDVVRESCLVALDAADYWGHSRSAADDDYDDNETPSPLDSERQGFAQHKARLVEAHFNIK
jgi:deoxyhypusine monooxygenase